MFELPLRSLVQTIVRSQFPKNAREGEALHIGFDVRLGDYSDDLENSLSAGVHLIYHCRFGNYITVFSGVTDRPFDDYKSIEAWTHEVTHDSCWRDIQIIDRVYFSFADELNRLRLEAGLNRKAPKEFNQFVDFLHMDSMFAWVPVEVTKDRRTLKVL
jgi:hypothetical protein